MAKVISVLQNYNNNICGCVFLSVIIVQFLSYCSKTYFKNNSVYFSVIDIYFDDTSVLCTNSNESRL